MRINHSCDMASDMALWCFFTTYLICVYRSFTLFVEHTKNEVVYFCILYHECGDHPYQTKFRARVKFSSVLGTSFFSIIHCYFQHMKFKLFLLWRIGGWKSKNELSKFITSETFYKSLTCIVIFVYLYTDMIWFGGK